MGPGIHVASLDAVREFRVSLSRFGHELREVIAAAEAEALRAVDGAYQGMSAARREVEDHVDDLAAAEADLAACRGRSDGADGDRCGSEEAAVAEARRRLWRAQEDARLLRSSFERIEDSVEVYRSRAERMRSFLDEGLADADRILAGKISAIEGYLAVCPPEAVDGASGSGSAGVRKSFVRPGPSLCTPPSPSSEGAIPPLGGDDPLEAFRRGQRGRYEELRRRTPTPEVRRIVNPSGPKVDPVYGHEVAGLEADHVVSVSQILRMPGFATLPFDRQVSLLNLPDNFVGVSPEVNASRGGRSWSEWKGHSRFGPVQAQVLRQMIDREEEVRQRIRRLIDGGGIP